MQPPQEMGVSKNSGTPKSSFLIGFSIINHPFWGFPPIFGNTHIVFVLYFFVAPVSFPGVWKGLAPLRQFLNTTQGSRLQKKIKAQALNAQQNDSYTILHRYMLYIYMCQGLNTHYFNIIGHGHQPNSRGSYTHYKDSC